MLRQIFSGATVALAMIPEAVAFSFVAKVPPPVALTAAWIMCFLTAMLGGRPGMISGATGATAVVMTKLVVDEGIQYLFWAVMWAGALQVRQLDFRKSYVGTSCWARRCRYRIKV